MDDRKAVSVLTATYNRRELLERLYRSLANQSDLRFEWIVVDDGSSDGTDRWIRSILPAAPFEMKYKINEHGGKHRAMNTGIAMSGTKFVFIVDSDDYLPGNAIETITGWIPDIEARDDLAGMSGLRTDPFHKVIGEALRMRQGSFIECSNLERYRMSLLGDKAEVYKTDILGKYPFPEYEGEFFLTERIVWDRIAADGYRIRWYNEPIYICEYQESGLSNSGANRLKGHLDNYQGYLAFVKQSLRFMEPLEAVTVFRDYNKTGRVKKLSLRQRAKELDFSLISYCYYLVIKMPALDFLRILRRVRKANEESFSAQNQKKRLY